METRVLTVTGAKTKNVNRRRPVIKLTGDWLEAAGFSWGKLVAAEYAQGRITLRLQDLDNYKELVKEALKSSSGMIQVRRKMQHKKLYSHLELIGFWLEQLGFTIGSVITVRYEYGFIKIIRIDLDKLEA